MHGDWLADDEAIADEFSDGLAGVGVGNLVNLVGVEPDLALTASDDGRSEALLSAKIDHLECGCRGWSKICYEVSKIVKG